MRNGTPSSRFLRVVLLVLVCTFLSPSSTIASQPIIVETPPEVSAAFREQDAWEREIFGMLEEQELPRFWAVRGLRYPIPRFGGDPDAAVDKIRELLNAAISHPTGSEAALYEIARQCNQPKFRKWCERKNVARQLIDAAPDNIAVHFADMPRLKLPIYDGFEELLDEVTEDHLARLKRASFGTYVDEYSEVEIFTWRELLNHYVKAYPPSQAATEVIIERYKEGIPPYLIRSYRYPAERIVWEWTSMNRPFTAYGSSLEELPLICAAVAAQDLEASIQHCRVVAEILEHKPRDPMHPQIAHRINQILDAMMNSESPSETWKAVRFSDDALFVEARCMRPYWHHTGQIPLGGLASLDAFCTDLDRFGYLEALRRAKTRERNTSGLDEERDREYGACEWRGVYEKYALRNKDLFQIDSK